MPLVAMSLVQFGPITVIASAPTRQETRLAAAFAGVLR
jgi:hypothetical protein